jgi:hypothetical protein
MTLQHTATGTYSDATTSNITTTAVWTVSDSTIATIGGATGLATYANAGKIWGADIGVTATLAPGTPGTSSLLVISQDSGSVNPLMPQQNNHWQALGLSPWGVWFGCQELTGNLVGSGSAGFTLTANGGAGIGVQYGQAPVGGGWLRTFIAITGSSNTRVAAAAAVGPNPSTTSVAFLGYINAGASGANTALLGMIGASAANRIYIDFPFASAGHLRLTSNFGNKNLMGPSSMTHTDRVHPILLIYNKTTSEVWAATDISLIMSGGQPAVADDIKGFGSIGAATTSSSISWLAVATGSIVEALCSASASADFLTRLGWTVTWKDCPTDSGSIKAPFLPGHWKSLGITPWTATWNHQEEVSALDTFDRWDGKNIIGWRYITSGVDAFRHAVPGWTRKGIRIILTNDRGVHTLATPGNSLFDPTGSFAMLVYATASGSSVAGTSAAILGTGCAFTSPSASWGGVVNVGGVQKPVIYCVANSTTGSITVPYGDRVHPWLFVYDVTNSRVKLYSDLEAVTGTFTQLQLTVNVTGTYGWGAGPGYTNRVACSGVYMYSAVTTGSQAELLSTDGQASQFLKTMGWSPTW